MKTVKIDSQLIKLAKEAAKEDGLAFRQWAKRQMQAAVRQLKIAKV